MILKFLDLPQCHPRLLFLQMEIQKLWVGLESLNIAQHQQLQDLDDRMRKVETNLHDVEGAVGILNKIFWIALTALITGSVAMIFWGTPSL